MLVTMRPHQHGETHIVPVIVSKVYATGHVVLEGSTQRYRASGYPTGKQSRWSHASTLSPWSDLEWQDFQRRQARDSAAGKVYRLSDRLAKIVRNDADEAAAIWESLPYAIRALIEDESK
jgi:hypothetical protein